MALEQGEHPSHHQGHPQQLHPHHQHQPEQAWQHLSPDFGDVNVQDYIKHDYGMENIEFPGYPGHHGPGADGEHGQYPHPQVSVAPPWVR